MWLGLLLSCAFHVRQSGLVDPDGASVYLRGYSGGRIPLVLDEDSAPVRFLQGCVVEVEGTRTPAGLVVSNWSVKDAGDGSSGFVGTLHAYGARVLLEDRNTGTTLVLDDAQAGALRAYDGAPVLVIGTVVGAGTVRVMAWRLLQADDPVPAPAAH